jgi:phosphoglycerate dehydrogenase-like enzyme
MSTPARAPATLPPAGTGVQGKMRVLLWLRDARPYREAVERAGLASRVDVHAVGLDTTPPDDLLATCDAMLAWHAKPGMLARAPRLRWIQALTAGVEGWLALPDLAPGIILTCARGTHRIQMPENILGALFHLTKPFVPAAFDQRDRRWTRRVSETLAGKTLGILGLGVIGQEVARKAAALEMVVIGTKRTPTPLPHVTRVHPPTDMAKVLGASDFVLLLLPVTADTRGIINASTLGHMRPGAYVLNFGRGELVVDEDLIEAVRARRIAGAVLDVFTTEPLPSDHPFWATEGITVLPHIGGLHPRRDEVVAELFVENLRRFLGGQALLQVVVRERGY